MLNRIVLNLENDEYAALFKVASRDLRNPEKQAHYILRRELVSQGLLKVGSIASSLIEDPKPCEKGGVNAAVTA